MLLERVWAINIANVTQIGIKKKIVEHKSLLIRKSELSHDHSCDKCII